MTQQYVSVPFHNMVKWMTYSYDSVADLQEAIAESVIEDAEPDTGTQTAVAVPGRPKTTGLPEDFPQDLWPRLLLAMRKHLQDNPEAWKNHRGTGATKPKTEQNKLNQGIVVWNNGIEAVFLTTEDGWPDPEDFMGPTIPEE